MKHLLSMAIVVLLAMVSLGLGVAGAASPKAAASAAAAAGPIPCDLNNLFTPADYLRCILYYELKPSTPQRYYLTKATVDGAHALSACAPGFHMANLTEILVPTGLLYLRDPNISFSAADDGDGAPFAVSGWVRTGLQARTANASGVGNCNTWTSALPTDFGTITALNSNWFDQEPPSVATQYLIAPWWVSSTLPCSLPDRVWCVEDLN